MWASKLAGPSGSLGASTTARDGWREASVATVAMRPVAASPGVGATTTSVSTDVRVRTRSLRDGLRHPCARPGAGRRGPARARHAADLLGQALPREPGPRCRDSCIDGLADACPPGRASGQPSASSMTRWGRTGDAIVGRRAPAVGPRPPGPRCRPRRAGRRRRAPVRRACARLARACTSASQSRPDPVERRDDAPGRLHLVRAGEQRGVAEHGVERAASRRPPARPRGTTSRT